MLKSIKEIRKAKGLTLETLSKQCGVSAKTILQYEHEPPKRPSRKVVDKLSSGLGITADELYKIIKAVPAGNSADGSEEGTIELSHAHITRIVTLVDKEIRDLQLLMLEYADMQEQHPGLATALEYLTNDLNQLVEIKNYLS